MSQAGALFASVGEVDYEEEDGGDDQRPRLMFKNFSSGLGIGEEWSVDLPENPAAVAVGNSWCAVVTAT